MTRARIEYEYAVETVPLRRLCDERPKRVDIHLFETVTTTTFHADGSTTEHRTSQRRVAAWTYTPGPPGLLDAYLAADDDEPDLFAEDA